MTRTAVGPWTLLAPPAPASAAPGAAPSLSVVIAAHQAADVVADAVASALEQTHPPLDVVVCDDGSTDDLDGALAPFRERVRLVRQPNRGEGAAKNAAIGAADGAYVVILDADDVFEPRRLEAMAAALALRPDLDILTTDATIELDGEPVRRVYDDSFRFAEREQRLAIVRDNFLFGLAAVRRDRLLAVGGYDEALRHATDWDLWVRMILGGAAAGLLDAPLARYRLRTGSLSSFRSKMLEGRLAVLDKTSARDDLSGDERGALAEARAGFARALARTRARAALEAGEPGGRALALAIARERGHGARSRLLYALAALAPRRVGRRLRRSDRETTAGLTVAPPAHDEPPSGAGAAHP